MFAPPIADEASMKRMADQLKANAKIAWVEKAALAWLHSGRDEISIDLLVAIYDDIHNIRDHESA